VFVLVSFELLETIADNLISYFLKSLIGLLFEASPSRDMVRYYVPCHPDLIAHRRVERLLEIVEGIGPGGAVGVLLDVVGGLCNR